MDPTVNQPEHCPENMLTTLARSDGQHMLSEQNGMLFLSRSRLPVRVFVTGIMSGSRVLVGLHLLPHGFRFYPIRDECRVASPITFCDATAFGRCLLGGTVGEGNCPAVVLHGLDVLSHVRLHGIQRLLLGVPGADGGVRFLARLDDGVGAKACERIDNLILTL